MPAAQTDPAPAARDALLVALNSIEPLVTMSRDGLVVIALGSTDSAPADYITLVDDQPAAFDFTELETGGSVPTVQVKVGLKPLVVLAGETIVGGKQNRIINVSLWLAAQKTTPIPVSCLEHGRWDAGHRFAAGRQVDLDLRAKVARMVAVNARSAAPRFASDQGELWREIAVKEQLAARRSETAALHDLYAAEAGSVDEFVTAFPVPDRACGAAIGVGGKLIALDLFDSADTLRKQWPRLIASAASAKLDFDRRVAAGLLPKPQHTHPDPGALGRMLVRAKKATDDAVVNTSPGEGWDVRPETAKLHGAALVHADRVVHLSLFRNEA